MSDIRLVQGLLITICLSLVCGIVLSVLEIRQTDTSQVVSMAPAPSAPAPAPAPAPSSTPAPAPAAPASTPAAPAGAPAAPAK